MTPHLGCPAYGGKLTGGVTVALLATPSPVPGAAARVVGYYVAALAGWGVGGAITAAAACLSAYVLEATLWRLTGLDVARLGCVAVVTCAAGMAAVGDLHGISLVSGMVTMLALMLVPLRARGLVSAQVHLDSGDQTES
ncbi:hypothetical protein Prum_058590 [Phytohabitans rumicis]|uniref:Uncharacterized protein n=1 Tax=Phytohabitans rumicis TaxID=1076125 RepID=A0A6V8LDV8_9ACTN|nr:hypothetical protein Prum_058590 [Phytohabitans rumicis]